MSYTPKDDLRETNLILDFIKYHRLDEGAIKSADQFYSQLIQNITNHLKINLPNGGLVKAQDITVERPNCKEIDNEDRPLFPYEAICRQATYHGRLMVSFAHYKNEGDSPAEISRKCIGMIPIMVKSSRCNLYNMTYHELVNKKECPFMLGGYFIYKGGLKSIISQEELAKNQLFRFHVKKTNDIKCEIRFVRNDYSHTHITVKYDFKTKLFYVILPFIKGGNTKQLELDEEGVSVKANNKSPISLGVFLKYFGIDDETMMRMIKMWHSGDSKCTLEYIDQIMEKTVEESILCTDPEQEFIKKLTSPNYSHEEKVQQVKNNLEREFFNGLGYKEQNINMITLMACRLIQLLAGDPVDDRDSYVNKRSDMAGVIMAGLYRSLVMKLFRDVQEAVDSSNSMNPFEVVVKNFNDKTITIGFQQALANGNFSSNSFKSGGKDGVSQVLLYNSLPCMISQIRRRAKPLDHNGKMVGPRQLHNMQWGIICASETPEGSPCGLTNNSSIVEVVSLERDLSALSSILEQHATKTPDDTHTHPLFINGMWEGWVDVNIFGMLKEWRLDGKLPFDVSIGMSPYGEIKINGDSGRSCRPCLIIGDDCKTVLEHQLGTLNLSSVGCTWADVIRLKAVEYIDKFEEESLSVAVSPWHVDSKHTHCELDPSAIFGYCANLIPFPSHNPGPRIAYECSMLKQAIGFARLNERWTLDTNAKVLDYPQKYITETDIARASGLQELGMGQVPIVAVLAAAYNQEDSIVVNKAAVDRGLFRTTVYKTYKEVQKTSEREIFCNPVPILYAGDNIKKKRKDYHLIEHCEGMRERTKRQYYDELPDFVTIPPWEFKDGMYKCNSDINQVVKVIKLESGNRYVHEITEYVRYEEECYEGAPRVGARVFPGDVLIGKIKYVDDKPIDCSIIHKGTDTGIVDTVMMTQNSEGNLIMDVKIRYYRIPKMGDKFAQRHAQKGVIGLICPEADMPFVATGPSAGMVPDVLINPHAFPSRMTIGYILELLLNKEGCVKGHYHQATAFRITDDIAGLSADELVKTIGASLKSEGYTPEGKEVMYDGKTGEPLKCRIYMGPVGYQALKHQVDDKMHCVDALTDVLTYSGWKNVTQITENDEIATLNNAGELEYQKPNKVFRYEDHEGMMYTVSNANIDLKVTAHHRMWVSVNGQPYNFREARDIVGVPVQYKSDAKWTVPDYQFVLPEYGNVDMDAWLKFMGVHYNYSHYSKDMIVCPLDKVSDILNIINTLNIKYKHETINNFIYITDAKIHQYVRNNPFENGFPLWVWKLSQKQCELLLDYIFIYEEYCTKHTKLRDDITRLCLHAGSSAKFKKTRCGNRWRIKIMDKPITNTNTFEEFAEEKCPVYCVEVPNERFYVRRNGKPVWTGNSRAKGPVQRLTRQPVEGRSRNGGLRFGEMESQCFTSYGSTAFLQERLLKVSDEYEMVVCVECGYIAVNNKKIGPRCLVCSKKGLQTDFAKITIPYPLKLLAQNMMACNIGFKFKVGRDSLTGEYEIRQLIPANNS